MAKLWEFFNGEPFMVNPHVGLINPRKGKKMAKRRKASPRRTARKSTRRRARRNPWPVAGMVVNPRRKRSSKRSGRKASRRRSGYRRNPSIGGISLPPIQSVVFAGIGFVAPPVVEGFISQFLPTSFATSTIGKYVMRIGAVLVTSFAVKTFIGAQEAKMTAIGGGVYVLSGAVAEFAPGLLPAGAPVAAYVPQNRRLATYVPANQRINNTMGALPSAAAFGGQNNFGVAARFKRY